MVPNVGNVDGPGATAKFALPERITVDANDNVYVWDNGNDSFRKIANDAAHTVSTHFARVGGLAVVTPTFMSGKLYWYGSTGTNVFLWETDPATANMKRVVFEGRVPAEGVTGFPKS